MESKITQIIEIIDIFVEIMPANNPLHIDVAAVLRQRLPRHARYIPRVLVRGLERFIRQKEMNEMLDHCYGLRGADFCREVMNHLDVSCEVVGRENLPASGTDSRVLFVSNHPLGGLDGIALIATLTDLLEQKVYAVVNDLLLAVEPLRDIFLPINKHGRQSRQNGQQLEEAFAGDAPILMFPAGMCSRRGHHGVIADLEWQKMFVNHALRHHRDIIPLHFSGINSRFFYNFASLRQKLGIKFNIEMTRLPAEVFLSQGKTFIITVGQRIPYSTLEGGRNASRQAQLIKQLVYNLHTNTSAR